MLLGQTDSKAMLADAFAYLGVENTQVPENAVKALRGQIRKCNLNESLAWLVSVSQRCDVFLCIEIYVLLNVTCGN